MAHPQAEAWHEQSHDASPQSWLGQGVHMGPGSLPPKTSGPTLGRGERQAKSGITTARGHSCGSVSTSEHETKVDGASREANNPLGVNAKEPVERNGLAVEDSSASGSIAPSLPKGSQGASTSTDEAGLPRNGRKWGRRKGCVRQRQELLGFAQLQL